MRCRGTYVLNKKYLLISRNIIRCTYVSLIGVFQLTGEMTKKMCFYLDSAAQATTPEPEEDTVYLMTSEPLRVAVYEFGGYAMQDSTWMKRVAEFADRLGNNRFFV